MYILTNGEASLKLYISDHEFEKLPCRMQEYYQPYVRTTPRPISNFTVREKALVDVETED